MSRLQSLVPAHDDGNMHEPMHQQIFYSVTGMIWFLWVPTAGDNVDNLERGSRRLRRVYGMNLSSNALVHKVRHATARVNKVLFENRAS
ncbi:hypothetical protein CLCR_11083 [Cladophialophora carrionii]|uniref:Uncharacterized protein n=1 Tax=Cladophialophora carrionii TaxID=86049 RepID=A0A1C1CZM3_9EURO|nr:hypothetical protein CLCR_11083 [Cladophialophora carrionii]